MSDLWLVLIAGACAVAAYVFSRRLTTIRALAQASERSLARLEADLGRVRSESNWSKEILEYMAEGVLVLDRQLRPTLTNEAARDLLGIQGSEEPSRLPSDEVLAVARSSLASDSSREEIITVWFPARMSLWVRAAPIEDGTGAVVVLQDITEELRIQRVRRDFVAHASHELKTPVTGLQTLAEALRRAVHDDPETAERFSVRLVAEAGRLGRLIEDLLDLSKLEDAAAPPDTPVDLSDVTRREVARLRDDAASAGIKLVSDIAPKIVVKGDGQQLGLAVGNLLENAIRYTPPRGGVTVELCEQQGETVLAVADTGIGIPLEAQARVFERFYRVDRARSRDKGGTGLGLAIVKHVIELHGGEVHLESELGRGSTFSARIPCASAPGESSSGSSGSPSVPAVPPSRSLSDPAVPPRQSLSGPAVPPRQSRAG